MSLKDTVNIPLIFQLLILELAIDGLRLAAMNTPSMLSTPLSVIAGIVMGGIFGQIRMVQLRGYALYGVCRCGELYTAEF